MRHYADVTINKIVDDLALEFNLPKKTVDEVTRAFVIEIVDHLIEGRSVWLRHFGTFRRGETTVNGKKYPMLRFKPSVKLKRILPRN